MTSLIDPVPDDPVQLIGESLNQKFGVNRGTALGEQPADAALTSAWTRAEAA